MSAAFKTIHTRAGLIAMARAEAAGEPINLTHMAVGDGGGAPVLPDWEQSQLVRERYRATINRVYQAADDATHFTAELVVPAGEGGWVMREIGVFDSDGQLFAVGNLPETYKPLAEEGSFGDAVLRLEFQVANSDVVTIMIDPDVAAASQAWVITNLTAAAIIPGGTVGQLLGKSSNADGAFEWQDPGQINVTVDTVAEKQLLADSQTVVDLSATTTYGLAVYIDGLRIDLGSGAGEWQPHEAISTRLILGQSYPAGTRITLVNNEPAGSAPAPLERNRNLGDVESKSAARNNLDIYSRAEVRQMAPAGMVAHFARATAPTGWLKANGAAVSRTAYAELFAAIGTTFGDGDGFTSFNLPDLRGEFLRGWDDGRGVDGGRELGGRQSSAVQSHTHSGSSEDAGGHSHGGTAAGAGAHSHSASAGAAGGHTHLITDSWWTPTVGADRSGNDNEPRKIRDYGSPDTYKNHLTSKAGDHTHAVAVGSSGSHTHNLIIGTAGAHSHVVNIGATGGIETRPRNVSLLACIKF